MHADDDAALRPLGWRAEDQAALGALTEGERVARVVEQHRSGYRVQDGSGVYRVDAPPALVRAGADPAARPAVGDWAVIGPGRPPMLRRILPRRTWLRRTAAGDRPIVQSIAANVDHVLVVMGLDGDYNPRRIERYLVVVEGSGANVAIVLTKRDLCETAESRRQEISRLVGAAVPVHAVHAKAAETATELCGYVGPGSTAALVGSSGAGKSTLTNTLLGLDAMRTGEVRAADSRGRHTTTHRALIPLPGGGCLIDMPGMRELKLTGEESLELDAFADIDALAARCRFGDCRHDREPGCAIRAALESGALEAARWESYLKLRDERDQARDGAEAARRRKSGEKVQTRALNKRLTDKYGSR